MSRGQRQSGVAQSGLGIGSTSAFEWLRPLVVPLRVLTRQTQAAKDQLNGGARLL